jgi:NADH-quinone oxidoreductase subunit H
MLEFNMPLVVQTVATLLKIALILGIAFQIAPAMLWIERRQMALTQRRLGPNRVGFFPKFFRGFGFFGLGQPVVDAIKLMFKEEFFPKNAHKIFYFLAPIITSTAAMMTTMGIPVGHSLHAFGETIDLRPIAVDVGFLFLFAMSSLGVYGVALAGWSSNSKYPLLGALRSSAQMISYELAMGLSLIPPVLIFGTMDLQKIVEMQAAGIWGVCYAPVSFVIFSITMFAETNRLPFDLAEGESELVAGFLTEYGGLRWSQFFLGEYAMMFALSALSTSIFLGGYELPFVTHDMLMSFVQHISGLEAVIAQWIVLAINIGVFLAKIIFFMLLFAQVRFTLPRFRYDQLMRLGWVVLLPVALVNIAVTALILGFLKF